MNRPATPVFLALTAAFLPARAPAGAPAAPATAALVQQLRDADPKAAEQALAKLLAAGKAGKAAARAAIKQLLDVRARRWDDAHRRLAARAAFLGDASRVAAAAGEIDCIAKAGKDMLDFALDRSQYPVYAVAAHGGWRPGKNYQKGQVHVEALTEIALGVFNQAEPRLVEAFGGKLSPKPAGGRGFAEDLRRGRLVEARRALQIVSYTPVDCQPAWARIAADFGGWYTALMKAQSAYDHAAKMAAKVGLDAPAKSPSLPGPSLAIAAAFAADYGAAVKLRPAGGAEHKLLDAIARRCVLVHNPRRQAGWSAGEKKLLRLLNLYRLSLGLSPLVANAKLHAAAREHSTWLRQHNLVGHGRPGEPKMATVFHRCAARGYRAAVGENVSYASRNPVWSWRADAGHHRNLIDRRIHAAGFGKAGVICTYNTGWLVEDAALRQLLDAPSKSPVRWWRMIRWSPAATRPARRQEGRR